MFVVVNGGAVSLDPLVPANAAAVAATTGTAGGLPATHPLPAAVVEAGYLCDNQQALADLLFGVENRWGKLAYTIYSQSFALRENPMPTASECGCSGTPAAYRTCVECSVGYLNMSMRASDALSKNMVGRFASGNNTNTNTTTKSNNSSTNRNYPGRGYRYYTGVPQYPFGHGLSLTTFKLNWHRGVDGDSSGATTAEAATMGAAPPVQTLGTAQGKEGHHANGKEGSRDGSGSGRLMVPAVEYSVDVTNTGERAGDEVVFMFFQPQSATALVLPRKRWVAGDMSNASHAHDRGGRIHIPTPVRKLIGFQRVRLEAGATTTVSFSADGDALSLVGADGSRWVVAGNYTLTFTNGVHESLTQDLLIHQSAARLVRSLPESATKGME